MMGIAVRPSPKSPPPMRSLFSPRLLPAIALQTGSLLLLAASAAHAASSTYIGNGTGMSTYSTPAIWDNGVPGLATGTANATPTATQQNFDIATFDSGTVTQAQAITFAQNYSLGGFNFLAGSAAYTFGSATTLRFYFNTGGSVLMNAGATNSESLGRTGMIVGAGGGTSTTYENDSTTATAIMATSSFSNGNSGSGTVILTGTNTGANTFANSGNAISDGSSPLSFIKNGTGTWIIDGQSTANTFTGGVTINNGTLRIGSGAGGATNGPTALGTGTLTINGGTLTSNSSTARTVANPLVLGASASFGDAVQTGAINLTNAVVTLAANTTLTANQATTVSGAIGDGSTGSGFGLTKGGTATLTLSGQSTYRGGTTVTAGILSATTNGALGTGNVTITGGILSLTATVTNAIADSAILSLAGGGVAGQADTGAIELLGTTTETVKSLILNGVTQQPGVYNSTTSSDFITGTGSITVMAVPEPSTWACGLLGLAFLARLGLKKRASVV